jgi:tetratricopeptide (TPR) repeat protein
VLRQLEAAKPNDLLVTQIDRRITQKWLGDLTPAEREAVGDLAEIRQPFPLDLARHIVAEHVEGPAEEFIVRQLFGLGILIPEPEGLVKLNSLIRLTLAAPSRGVGGKIADYYLHLADSNPPLGLDLDLIGSSVTCLAESQPEKALKLLNWIGPSMSNSGMHDQLADLTHSFLPNLAPSPKTVTAWMNVGLGYHRAHKLGLAACEYRIALEAAEELNLEHTKMRCLLNLGDVESNSARLEDAELHLQQAAELARKLEDRSSEAFALRTMGYVERQRHENELGVQFTTKALALYTLIGDVPGRVWCIGCLASCYFEAGAYEQARSRFLESLAIQREIGDMHGVAWNLTYLGETCTYLGELKQGEAFVREALSLQTDPQLFHRLSWPLRILGENLVLQGDFKGAEATFCRSLDSVRDSGNKTGEALTLIRLAEVSQAAEEISTARAYLDLAQEIAASTQNPQIQAEVTRVAEKINSGKRTSSDY